MIEKLKPKNWQNFWSKVFYQNGCWVWMGYKDKKGYGKFSIHKLNTRNSSIGFSAYRLTYELFKGEIPNKYTIDHLCRNRACVNPEHLEAVTCKENVLRGIGICSINKKKTHCPQGHEYNLENTYFDKGGGRYCRVCRIQIQKRYIMKKRMKAYY